MSDNIIRFKSVLRLRAFEAYYNVPQLLVLASFCVFWYFSCLTVYLIECTPFWSLAIMIFFIIPYAIMHVMDCASRNVFSFTSYYHIANYFGACKLTRLICGFSQNCRHRHVGYSPSSSLTNCTYHFITYCKMRFALENLVCFILVQRTSFILPFIYWYQCPCFIIALKLHRENDAVCAWRRSSDLRLDVVVRLGVDTRRVAHCSGIRTMIGTRILDATHCHAALKL